MGMTLTLSKMPKKTKLCIVERGSNSPGEIKKLSKIANPNISIITNMGSAHAGNFKNPRKKIVEEKSQIFKHGFLEISSKNIKYDSDDDPVKLVYSSPSFTNDDDGKMIFVLIYEVNKNYIP